MRLIDADKFDAVMGNIFDHLYESGKADLAGTLAAFMDMVKRQPTIDAVPVVRCRDCRHYRKNELGVMLCYNDFWNDAYAVHTNLDDFCSYGERKDGDG